MKKLISSIVIVALVGMMVITVIYAAEATITATVTVQNISVSVSDGSVAYGTLPLDTTKSTCDFTPVDTQTVRNTGNVTEDFNIKGQDSAAWTLGATAGANTYVHKFSTSSCPVTWGGTALTTSYQTLTTGIAKDGTVTLNLQIHTPTQTSSYEQQSVDVTIQAVASS